MRWLCPVCGVVGLVVPTSNPRIRGPLAAKSYAVIANVRLQARVQVAVCRSRAGLLLTHWLCVRVMPAPSLEHERYLSHPLQDRPYTHLQ